jgi:hypothetical protein
MDRFDTKSCVRLKERERAKSIAGCACLAIRLGFAQRRVQLAAAGWLGSSESVPPENLPVRFKIAAASRWTFEKSALAA